MRVDRKFLILFVTNLGYLCLVDREAKYFANGNWFVNADYSAYIKCFANGGWPSKY